MKFMCQNTFDSERYGDNQFLAVGSLTFIVTEVRVYTDFRVQLFKVVIKIMFSVIYQEL